MPMIWLVALAAISAETNAEKLPVVELPITIMPTAVSPKPPKKDVESPPIPKNYPGIWASSNDYPPKALQEKREGITAFQVTVSPEGVVTNCLISESSGHADLDETTCANVTKRAQFYPAQGKKGKPVTGKYSNRVRWQIPVMTSNASFTLLHESFPRPPRIVRGTKLSIAKEDYPASALAAAEQGVSAFMLDVDTIGKVGNCSIISSSGSPALDQQSCTLAAKWTFEPARDIDGRPAFGKSKHILNWRLPKGAPRVSAMPIGPANNPFAQAGSVVITLDFDATGKLAGCATEQKAAFPITGQTPKFIDSVCKDGYKRNIKPFIDANGKPEAKRVIFRMGVEHEAVPPSEARDQ